MLALGQLALKLIQVLKLYLMFIFHLKLVYNLLSVGQLLEQDYTLLFKDRQCSIHDSSGKKLLSVAMKNKCFPLNWKNLKNQAYHCLSGETKLWHKRLGHINYGSLKHMVASNLVEGLPNLTQPDELCDTYQFGKQRRKPFPKQAKWRATQKLKLVHTDIGGPMRTPSLNESRFYLLFIDDLSRYSWVYFLKQKSEAFSSFVKFRAMVENQASLSIKMLRSDNGTEYTALEFERYLAELGIKHQLTVSYCP